MYLLLYSENSSSISPPPQKKKSCIYLPENSALLYRKSQFKSYWKFCVRNICEFWSRHADNKEVYCLQSRRGREDEGREFPNRSVQFSFRLLGITSWKTAMLWGSVRCTIKISESGRAVSAPRLLEYWEPWRRTRCVDVPCIYVCHMLCYVTALKANWPPTKRMPVIV